MVDGGTAPFGCAPITSAAAGEIFHMHFRRAAIIGHTATGQRDDVPDASGGGDLGAECLVVTIASLGRAHRRFHPGSSEQFGNRGGDRLGQGTRRVVPSGR